MKKIITFIVVIISLTFSFNFVVFSADYSLDVIEDEISRSLEDIMEDDLKDALSALGIDDISFESIYNVSLSSILNYFSPEIKNKAENILKSFVLLFSLIMILSVFAVVLNGSKNEKLISFLAMALIMTMTAQLSGRILNSCLSVMKLSGNFMVSFVPILTLIIALSGNPTGALTYNTAVLGFAEILNWSLNGVLVDVMGCFFCLSIAFSMNDAMNVGRLVNAVNRAVSFFFGIAGTMFASFLSFKNIMAVSADSLSVKGIRFLLSSLVPIVGSSISEAYSSVLGSISLIKSSVAVIGIIGVAIINLPVIIETLLVYISFLFLSYISEVTGLSAVSDFFKAVSAGIRIILLAAIFEIFLLVISTGIMLTFKSGG